VGLATFLLNIENDRQVSRDPLRGNLFENLVISEALKYRFNQGRPSNLYFYRDSKANEVDLGIVNGSDLFPIEIKCGMTITRDYIKGLRHFRKFFRNSIPRGSGLVYGGQEGQRRTDETVVTVYALQELWDKID
jgi:predicted AAA+ superfamily ATPase